MGGEEEMAGPLLGESAKRLGTREREVGEWREVLRLRLRGA